MNSQTLFEQITNLETELQKLKLEVYLKLPKKQRASSRYSEKSVLNAVRVSRDKVWKNRYAGKI